MSKTDRPASAEPHASVTGYAKPPEEHRFKKGTSGNPSGRRKEPKPIVRRAEELSLAEMILEEGRRSVKIREGDRTEEVPMKTAVVRSLWHSAAKGNIRAALAISNMVRTAEDRAFEDQSATFRSVMEYKTIWRETFEAYDRAGEPRPDPVPHPDDIAVDARTLSIRYNGPFDEGEKVTWDTALTRKREAEMDILTLREDLIAEPEYTAYYEEEIASAELLIDHVSARYPDEKTRRKADFDLGAWRAKQIIRQQYLARARAPAKS